MSFLQPILLMALVAAGIPLILHLLTLRKLTVVPFSTLAFLKELQRSRVRAVRLRQLLLLLLRTVLILLIVMAFARPAFQGTLTPIMGGNAQTDALIIVDDSYSMSVRNAEGSFLRQAADGARSVLDGLDANDRVSILPLSAVSAGRALSDAQWVSPREASAQLDAIRLSPLHVSLEKAIRFAAGALAERTTIHRELYIISDFQRGLVPSAPVTDDLLDGTLRLAFIRIGPPEIENMSMTSVSFTSTIVETDMPASFDLGVRNYRSDAPRTANISLFLESQRLDQRVLQLADGEERHLELRGSPQRSGYQSGSIILDGDDVEFDNTYWYVLRIPSERRVLLVGEQREIFHTALALATARSEGRSGFRITSVHPSRLTAAMLKDNDVFVLFDHPLRDDVRRTLKEQVVSGKGVILVPSSEPGPARSGRSGADELGSSFDRDRTALQEGGFLTFGRSDIEHPLFEGMFTPRASTGNDNVSRLESPDVYAYNAHTRPGGGRSVLELSNGLPFLTESVAGAGRVLTYAVSFVPEWSTFPVTGLFVPLLHRSIVYVSGDRSYRPSIEPGEEIMIPLPARTSARLQLRSPDGDETPVQPVIRPTGPVFRTTDAVMPGIYSLRSEGDEIDRFAVNLSRAESDPVPLSTSEILAISEALGLQNEHAIVLDAGDDLSERVYSARVGTELWPLLLFLALVIALVETWFAGTLRTEPPDGQST